MKLKINLVKDLCATKGTSQIEYKLNITLTIDNNSYSGEIYYIDCGNNAEYESQIEINRWNVLNSSYETLERYQDEILECLSNNDSFLYTGQEFQYNTQIGWNPILKHYVVFNPVLIDKETVFNVVNRLNIDTSSQTVIDVSLNDNIEPIIRLRRFKGIDADLYGYDMYLCDTSGNILSVGSFD